ncbi:hypothetical protein ScPMuIL_008532 [Solemya velum]
MEMSSGWNRLLLFVMTLTYLFFLTNEENISGQPNDGDEFDFDGLPGTTHEFKWEVAAGSEDCFFQKMKRGANFYVSFEVLRGGDEKVNLYLFDPAQNLIESQQFQKEGLVEKEIEIDGLYQLCIDNSQGRFASKLVYIFIAAYVAEEWGNYIQELEDLDVTVANFTGSLAEVEESVDEIMKYQANSRMSVIKDWYMIRSNKANVKYWSMFLCTIIIATSGFQVYFVRRLFSVPSITPSKKPRA